ncbi:hypothetical protein SAMN05192573_12188 [Mucilaginibacter gossypii]|uniref:Uncharacterized protein n=1 Tax=Mucilaginibacter gossypii TaxID=551996 RepID=A0A1G8KVB4_9SPHI|nr:hypothetical protein SAMN05192573_12188 [Mucilaginibacter gossypii]
MLAGNLLKISAKNLVNEIGETWPPEFATDSRGVEARESILKLAGIEIAEHFDNYKKKVNSELERLLSLEKPNTFSSVGLLGMPRHNPEVLAEVMQMAYDSSTPASEIAGLIHISYRNRKLIESEEFILRVKYYINVTKVRKYVAGFAPMENYQDFCTDVKDNFNKALAQMGEKLGGDFRSIEYEFYMQGSAVWKRYPTDPFPEGVDPNDYTELPAPGDVEFAIIMDSENFDAFIRELDKCKVKATGRLKDKIKTTIKYTEKNNEIGNSFLKYFKVDDTDALSMIQNAGFTHLTGVASSKKIGFKIFKSGTIGALEPLIPFKYK